jgi:hypothetical protein
MLFISINEREFCVSENLSILEACQYVGIKVPRFCYHEQLSVAGNCRMCLVETDKSPKPVASCATPILEDLEIFTETPLVLKARESVLEALLLNHPLDCPICDQGGECDLQDQFYFFGAKASRHWVNKRSVTDKVCGPIIKTVMTRCIHCTRCVRFGAEICGVPFLGTLNRGNATEISNYVERLFVSEISGNVIDLCPVGALTSNMLAFKYRPWELQALDGVDLTDADGNQMYLHLSEYGVMRVLPKKNKDTNAVWLSDKARYSFDAIKPAGAAILSNSAVASQLCGLYEQTFQGVTIAISDDLDMHALHQLKRLIYKSGCRVHVKRWAPARSRSNLYLWGNRPSRSQMDACRQYLLVGCNLRAESIILNTKLRAKSLQGGLGGAYGFFYQATYPVIFYSLTLSSFMSALQFKNSMLHQALKGGDAFAVFVGMAVTMRCSTLDSLMRAVTESYANLQIFPVALHSNSEGAEFFGLTSHEQGGTCESASNGALVSLLGGDHVALRKGVIDSASYIICNTGLGLVEPFYQSGYAVAVKSSYESGGLYMGSEQKPQIAPALAFDWNHDYATSADVLGLLGDFTPETNDVSLAFLQASASGGQPMFNHAIELQSFSHAWEGYADYSMYPLKPIFEDSYRSNSVLKLSTNMARCSQLARSYDGIY